MEIKEKQESVEGQNFENEALAESVENTQDKKLSETIRAERLKPISIFGLVLIGVLIIALVGTFGIGMNKLNNLTANEKPPEYYHRLGVEDVARMKYYDFKLTEWDYYTPNSYAIRDGEKYIKLKLEITNTRNEDILSDEPIFCYDQHGMPCGQPERLSADDNAVKFEPQYIASKQKYEAWLFFIVPENETKLVVNYGQYITVTVDLTEEVPK